MTDDLTKLVRPLVWEDRTGRILCEANPITGIYEIYQDGGWIALWHNGVRCSGALPSIEAAKSAAQADYAARIIAALDPSAVAKIREDALKEARALVDHAIHNELTLIEAYDAILALIEKDTTKWYGPASHW